MYSTVQSAPALSLPLALAPAYFQVSHMPITTLATAHDCSGNWKVIIMSTTPCVCIHELQIKEIRSSHTELTLGLLGKGGGQSAQSHLVLHHQSPPVAVMCENSLAACPYSTHAHHRGEHLSLQLTIYIYILQRCSCTCTSVACHTVGIHALIARHMRRSKRAASLYPQHGSPLRHRVPYLCRYGTVG